MLGHGSFDEAKRFHHYFPLEHLYVSEDHAAFEALPLKRGGVLDFINPLAAITAFGSAGRALSQPGVLESKKEQVLPQSDFWQLGGLFHLGPGEACRFHRISTGFQKGTCLWIGVPRFCPNVCGAAGAAAEAAAAATAFIFTPRTW